MTDGKFIQEKMVFVVLCRSDGCEECGPSTHVVGVFTDEKSAREAEKIHDKIEIRSKEADDLCYAKSLGHFTFVEVEASEIRGGDILVPREEVSPDCFEKKWRDEAKRLVSNNWAFDDERAQAITDVLDNYHYEIGRLERSLAASRADAARWERENTQLTKNLAASQADAKRYEELADNLRKLSDETVAGYEKKLAASRAEKEKWADELHEINKKFAKEIGEARAEVERLRKKENKKEG